ncbi:Nn.00g099780.m01.CDS01 [Neocucurbitaria sp. VM-36]
MDSPNEQASADIKKVVIAGLGMVPEIGVVLALVADILWPENHTDPVAEMKSYVKQMMQQVMDDVKVQAVEEQFLLVKAHMLDIKYATSAPAKRKAEQDLFNKTTDVRVTFNQYHDTQPWNTLPYLIAFGTIRLQCMRDAVLHYHDLWDADDSNPALTKQRLKDEIKTLKGWVETSKAMSLQWRNAINKQHFPQGLGSVGYGPIAGGHPGTPERWEVMDAHDPSFQKVLYQESQADICVANRQWDLLKSNGGFASRLDQLIDTYRFWDFLDPDTPYKPTPGPFYLYTRMGDGVEGGDAFNHATLYKNNGPMTQLKFWWDGGALKGLQVWYGNIDSGLVGMATNSGGAFGFGSGEVISVIGGYAGNWVDRFYYNTNVRKVNGQSVMGPAPVSGDFAWQPDVNNPAQPGDLRVAYFAGVNNKSLGRIGQLKVAWEKTVDYNANLGDEHNLEPTLDFSQCHPQ